MAWYLGVGDKFSRGMKGTDKPPKTPIPEGKKIKKKTSDALDKEIKRLEVAAQTPKERRARRTRRYHMLRNKPVS